MERNELLQEIYQSFSGKVEAYIRSRVADTQDVEDIASQVFLKVCQNIDRFSEEKAARSTWVYTITHNTVIDYYRKRGGMRRCSYAGNCHSCPSRTKAWRMF